MSTDGGLRMLVRKNIPDFHWQAVETGGVGLGIPDDNFCGEGVEGWVEHKTCDAFKPAFRPEQVGWVERRLRAHGRVFIMVRRRHTGGPRKGPPVDDLWLFPGGEVRRLVEIGLPRHPGARGNGPWTLLWATGGPRNWPWSEIRRHLLEFDFLSLQNSGIERKPVAPAANIKET